MSREFRPRRRGFRALLASGAIGLAVGSGFVAGAHADTAKSNWNRWTTWNANGFKHCSDQHARATFANWPAPSVTFGEVRTRKRRAASGCGTAQKVGHGRLMVLGSTEAGGALCASMSSWELNDASTARVIGSVPPSGGCGGDRARTWVMSQVYVGSTGQYRQSDWFASPWAART